MKSSGSARAERRNNASLASSSPAAADKAKAAKAIKAATATETKKTTKTSKTADASKTTKTKATKAVKAGKSLKAAPKAEPKVAPGVAESAEIAASAAVVETAQPAKAAKPAKSPKAAGAPRGGRTRDEKRDDKDQPLFEDIRYLGRLLGDVVREQEGDAVFEVVESIRQTAVRFRREDDNAAALALEKQLRGLSPEQTVSVVRAFSYFSHLANIAEDRHRNRRRRIHDLAGSAPQAGTIAHSLERLAQAGAAATPMLQQFFNDALIVPVLTAHPTEVQRKSTLDSQHDVARLLAERDQPLTHREREHNEALLRARVTSLWQTRMLRDARLTVTDEIENALSYYHTTFLTEIPALYGEIETSLKEHGLSARLPAFFQMGSWIGGDRDGNPNVTSATLEEASERQAQVILQHYLDEVHKLGAELSVSNLLAGASDELKALAEASPDQSPHRVDEPYRRALIGVYTRLAASARVRLGEGVVAVRSAGRNAAPV
ncbi:phosphoenolpyruvate carboxylase, partial [Paraburkholderia sp. Ac-20347]|uniref:phosphoenolpyruvate carboxylase n=1 Tax=Paraburkholderia sp. Ac-20347 TaxID=2703892 RepID=UPI001980FD80|nr:phosphoenolpyruvate carboxylase [Paraburkholderia sp. Ac-20347]